MIRIAVFVVGGVVVVLFSLSLFRILSIPLFNEFKFNYWRCKPQRVPHTHCSPHVYNFKRLKNISRTIFGLQRSVIKRYNEKGYWLKHMWKLISGAQNERASGWANKWNCIPVWLLDEGEFWLKVSNNSTAMPENSLNPAGASMAIAVDT